MSEPGDGVAPATPARTCNTPLRVLFDARPGAGAPGGISRYAATTGEALRASQRHLIWTLGAHGDCSRSFPSLAHEELALPYLLERERIDVFHSPLFRLPALLPCRSVVTVHDAIPIVRPELVPAGFAEFFQRSRGSMSLADAVVCPTEAAKRDLVQHLGLSEELLHVVPEAPAEVFGRAHQGDPPEVRSNFGLPSAYVLVVGGLEARKNPAAALSALAQLKSAGSDLHCVFAGRSAGYALNAESQRLGVEDRVHALGVVSDEDLAALYRGATALVFPSHYEGFGLPIVEAFACGAPVITSTDQALTEVGGDAALQVEAEDFEGLANAIDRVAADRGLADELRVRGSERLDSHFTRDHALAAFDRLYDSIRGTA